MLESIKTEIEVIMTRLFAQEKLSDRDTIELNEEDSRYISQVLRMRPGEEVTVVDADGLELICEISEITKKQVTLNINDRRENSSEPPFKVTLFQCVSKGERMDLTVQKCTELGVSSIVPVLSERCVVKMNAKDSKGKIDRWQKIALEASRQSGRGIVPKIEEPMPLEKAYELISDYDLTIFPWEEETGKGLKSALQSFNGKKIAIFIGPEGGFSQKEADDAVDRGAIRVTLGPRILRTETAGAAVLAMIIYESEI